MSRVLFYCQFRHSLGHFARTRLIAAKVADGGGECHLLFGGRRPPGLSVDPRIQVLDLPDASDSLTDAAAIAHRADLIRSEIDRIRPDKVLVDYLPLGLGGELMESLWKSSPESEFVWGMPYPPGAVKAAPRNPRTRKALARFQTALVYTSEGFLDPVESYRAYGLPPQVRHVGVVVPETLPSRCEGLPLVVGLAGAGIGAEAVINLLLQAAGPLAEAGRLRLRLVAGVYHQAAEAVERAKALPNVEVLERGGAEVSSQDATVVVARCGYNTAFSMANTDLPVIFLPWYSPDPSYTEQFDRAGALAELDGIWSVDERSKSAAQDLLKALTAALERGRRDRALPFGTEGAQNAADMLLSPVGAV